MMRIQIEEVATSYPPLDHKMIGCESGLESQPSSVGVSHASGSQGTEYDELASSCASDDSSDDSSSNDLSQPRCSTPGQSVENRKKFLALCVDSEDPNMLKVVNVDLTGVTSDSQAFHKIKDTYFDERGNPFFNWVYKHTGWCARLRQIQVNSPASLRVVYFGMADRNSQRQLGTWAFKPSLQDIPLTASAPIVLKEQVRWSYDWTKPSENFALAVTEFLFSAFLKPPKAMPYGLDRTEFLPKKRYTPVEYIFSFGEYDLQPGLGIYITEKQSHLLSE